MKDLILNTITKDHVILLDKVDYNAEAKLFSTLQRNRIDLNRLDKISNQKRRIEWMTVRNNLISYFKESIDIKYDSENKPHLSKTDYHISLSHSEQRIAISLQKNSDNGIDIQHITPKIERIRHKFLNDREAENIPLNDIETLTYYWSIKEALFKVYGKNDIFLKENIAVSNFDIDSRTAIGTITAKNYYKKLKLNFDLIEDYTLAYIVNS